MMPDHKEKHESASIQLKQIKYRSSNEYEEPSFRKPLNPRESDMRDENQIALTYDSYRIPPNMNECYIHQKVTQFGVPSESNAYQCKCCGQSPKQKLPICCNIEDIYKVNESLGFYFTYVKVMLLMLLTIAFIVGPYSLKELITNCNFEVNCLKIYGITILKFHVFFNSITSILVAVIVILMYGFNVYLYYTNAHEHRKVFLDSNKASNFSVLISNVDHEKVSGQAILDHFKDYTIEDILYTHQIKQYLRKLGIKAKLMSEKKLYEKKSQNREVSKKIIKLQKKIQTINEYLFNIKKSLTPESQKSARTDKIIIKFKSIEQKIRFQKEYRPNFCESIQQIFCNNSKIQINGNKLYVQSLGQPQQILWQNLEVTSRKRIRRVAAGTLLSLIVLGGSYLFAAIINRLEQTHAGTSDYLFSILFSIGVQVANLIMEQIVQQLTEWQKRYTLTSKYRIMMVKIFISYFINTTVMPFTFFLFDLGTKNEDDSIINVFTVFFILNFQLPAPFLINFLKISYIVKIIMRRLIVRQGKQCLVTQVEANRHFEKYDFELHSKFGKIIQIVSNAVFYAAIFPLGLIFTICGLVLTYWSSKAFLVQFSSIPKQSYRLGRLANDITVFFPTILAFGYALNEIMIPGRTEFNRVVPFIIGILTIPFGILFVIFGNKLAEKVVQKKYGMSQQIDGQIQLQKDGNIHGRDYRNLNPTNYIHSGVHDYIKQKEFQVMLQRLENYAVDQNRRSSQLNQ